LRTLFYLHYTAAAFDFIRAGPGAVLAHAERQAALRQVDRSLYILWLPILRDAGSPSPSAGTWQPPSEKERCRRQIFHLLLTLQERARRGHVLCILRTRGESDACTAFPDSVRVPPLVAPQNGVMVSSGSRCSHLALFFTRSIFQWPFMLLFAVCLMLFGVPRSRWISSWSDNAGSRLYLASSIACAILFNLILHRSEVSANSSGRYRAAKYAAYLNETGHLTRATAAMPSGATLKTKLARSAKQPYALSEPDIAHDTQSNSWVSSVEELADNIWRMRDRLQTLPAPTAATM